MKVLTCCLFFALGVTTNGLGASPSLKELMIDSDKTGAWKTHLGSARVPWNISFAGDGKFTAVAKGELTHSNRFNRTKSIDWKQEATGTWELQESGKKSTLTMTVSEVKTTFTTTVPTPEELKKSGETLIGMFPYEEDVVRGAASFELNALDSTLKRLVWTYRSGKKAFAGMPDSKTLRTFGAGSAFYQNQVMMILDQAE